MDTESKPNPRGFFASTGYPSILHPISAQLFAHLVRLYENNSESVPSKYDDILAHLARHPAYVEAAQLQDIEKVVTLQAGRLERKTGKLSGEGVSITMLSNLSHLVQHTPAEMSSHQVLMLLDMFCSCGPVFLGSEATYRTKVAFFKLVNIYLSAYGRDVSGRCSSLLKALLGPTMAALNSNNDGLKDVAAEYLYIQLVLGGFEPLPSVESDDWMVLLERIISWAIQQTKETKNW